MPCLGRVEFGGDRIDPFSQPRMDLEGAFEVGNDEAVDQAFDNGAVEAQALPLHLIVADHPKASLNVFEDRSQRSP